MKDARDDYIQKLSGLQTDGVAINRGKFALFSAPGAVTMGDRSTLSPVAARLEGFMRSQGWNYQLVKQALEELK
jgi:hypothetical protein